MSNQMTLPDQPHIEQLRKRLWTNREVGQAAVMVGAGFSRNAERMSSRTPPFPLWADLAKVMYGALYQPAHGAGKQAEVRLGAGETLRLASEYETAFGRSALDDLLLRSIPDTSYYPGQLHELLLSLPWSDVFTTNYDTLLERTLPLIHDRKYDVVNTASDIPVLTKPRIVKLHGSFTAHRPFIITEEDYRTYPVRFPPFVNLVQQSIMENVFCLVGFSGDDPNFLYWTGWVRDNLGGATPPIYLCGLLNLSASQRKLLEKRFVIPIDLSPLLANSELKDSPERFALSLEWFLKTLKSGEPPSAKDWPEPSARVTYKAIDDLPEILPGPPSLPDPGPRDPGTAETPLPPEKLKSLSETWRRTRECYPGWVVLPHDNRRTLFAFTKQWVGPVLESIGGLGPPDDLFLLHELNWRLEKALTPLADEWVGKMEAVVESYNPNPRLVENLDARIRPDADDFKDWSCWEWVRECWVELAFALARKARESQNREEHELWMWRLEKVIRLRPEWRARWFYELCLFHLFRLDQEQLLQTLEAWPANMDLPFWEARRAAILAELGQMKEAERIAVAALNEIRSSLQPSFVDYSILSKEGWIMLLLSLIKLRRDVDDESDVTSRFMNRWEKLRVYRCDPWDEMEMLTSVMKGADLRPGSTKGIRQEFDPGKVLIWKNITFEPRFFELQPAFAFLRIFEEGAMPIRVGAASPFTEAAAKAATWVRSLTPFWSLSAFIRASDRKVVEEWFDRLRIATMGDDEVARYYELLSAPFGQMLQRLSENPRAAAEGRDLLALNEDLLAELISRLSLRLRLEDLQELLARTNEVYSVQVSAGRAHGYKLFEALYKRALDALPEQELFNMMPALLSLPLPGEGRPGAGAADGVVEPLNLFEWRKGVTLGDGFDRSSWHAAVARLLRVAQENNPVARSHAISRLAKVHYVGGLSEAEARSFGEALWSQVDAHGLPAHTWLELRELLKLPEPEPGRARQKLREMLLAVPASKLEDHLDAIVRVSFFAADGKPEQTIDWTQEEFSAIVGKLAAWWDENRAKLARDGDSAPDADVEEYMVNPPLYEPLRLLSWTVLPRLGGADAAVKEQVKRVFSEMRQSGNCTLPALPVLVALDPATVGEVTDSLRAGLNQTSALTVRYSVFGLMTWLLNGAAGALPAPPADLTDELVNKVVTRRQPGLDSTIYVLCDLYEKAPEVLTERHGQLLCTALDLLFSDTKLPSEVEREKMGNMHTAVAAHNRPEYRGSAAELSRRLHDRLVAEGKEIPPVLLKWRDSALADPLPEVRRAWL